MGSTIMIGIGNLAGISLNHPLLPAETDFVTEVSPENPLPTVVQSNNPTQTLERAAKRFAETPAAFTEAITQKRPFQLTRKHGDVIRLRLQGLFFYEIAEKLGLSYNAVRVRLNRAKPFLHDKTIERMNKKLEERGLKERLYFADRRRHIIDKFFEELNRHPTPHGAVRKTARILGLTERIVIDQLRAGGINSTAEIQRKQLEFALKVAATMDQTFEDAQEQLRVSRKILTRYLELVREGKHLQGALELVESPEAQQWWDLQMPLVTSENGTGKGKINLTVRNETIEKDLELFDLAIQEAKREMVQWHPDKDWNGEKPDAEENFKTANKQYQQLKLTRAKYKENERRFRQKYGLPLHQLIEPNEA